MKYHVQIEYLPLEGDTHFRVAVQRGDFKVGFRTQRLPEPISTEDIQAGFIQMSQVITDILNRV